MARVFLVDDHPIVLDTVRDTIELSGEHTVTGVARSASAAIELLRFQQTIDNFDVAVVDGLGGLGRIVAEAIQHLGKPVIGFSLSTVTFGDVNLTKDAGRQALLDVIAELAEAPAETEK